MDGVEEFLGWIENMISESRALGDEAKAREWEALRAEILERGRSTAPAGSP
jgi:hypothetical protein